MESLQKSDIFLLLAKKQAKWRKDELVVHSKVRSCRKSVNYNLILWLLALPKSVS